MNFQNTAIEDIFLFSSLLDYEFKIGNKLFDDFEVVERIIFEMKRVICFILLHQCY